MISHTCKRRYKRSIWCQTVQILDWELTQRYCGTVGCKPPMDYRLKSMSNLGMVISREDQCGWGRDWYDLPANPAPFETALYPCMVSTLMSYRRCYFLRETDIWCLKIIPKATSGKWFVTFLGKISVLVRFFFMTLHTTFFTSHSWLLKAHSHSSTLVIIFHTNKKCW